MSDITKTNNIFIQSDIPLTTEAKDKAIKNAKEIYDKNYPDKDSFLLKIITDENKMPVSLMNIKNKSELISCLRCVLNALFFIDPTLTEATVQYFFLHETPQNNHKNDDNLH